MRQLLLTLTLLFAPALATAAPWCLNVDATEFCNFATAEECYLTANERGGFCSPNPREIGARGEAPYCVITATLRNCSYRSKAACLRSARQKLGGCVRNTEKDLERRATGQGRLAGCDLGDVGCDSGAPPPDLGVGP